MQATIGPQTGRAVQLQDDGAAFFMSSLASGFEVIHHIVSLVLTEGAWCFVQDELVA